MFLNGARFRGRFRADPHGGVPVGASPVIGLHTCVEADLSVFRRKAGWQVYVI